MKFFASKFFCVTFNILHPFAIANPIIVFLLLKNDRTMCDFNNSYIYKNLTLLLRLIL